MDHSFHIPGEACLQNIVLGFWQAQRDNPRFCQETILPKGGVEIIFNLDTSSYFVAHLGDRPLSMPRCFIQAYHIRPIQLLLPEEQSLFGIVLHPTAVKYLFGIPAGEFAAQCIDMTLVDPSFSSLWHQLAEQDSFKKRKTVFSNWLKTRIPFLTDREKAFNHFLFHKTDKTVPELSGWLCYSTRQLSRKCKELTGMNTEQVLIYDKQLRATELIHHSDMSLTEIAYICGFADQSHFIKTFRSFTNMTPSAYRKQRSALPGHLFELVR